MPKRAHTRPTARAIEAQAACLPSVEPVTLVQQLLTLACQAALARPPEQTPASAALTLSWQHLHPSQSANTALRTFNSRSQVCQLSKHACQVQRIRALARTCPSAPAVTRCCPEVSSARARTGPCRSKTLYPCVDMQQCHSHTGSERCKHEAMQKTRLQVAQLRCNAYRPRALRADGLSGVGVSAEQCCRPSCLYWSSNALPQAHVHTQGHHAARVRSSGAPYGTAA